MKLAYIDACIWIAAIEGLAEYQATIDQQLRQLTETGWTLCISELVSFEVLAKPMQQDQADLVEQYTRLLETLRMLPTYVNVFKDALYVSCTEGLKGIDAMHIALATHHKCQLFVSTDPHFRKLKQIQSLWIDLGNSLEARAQRSTGKAFAEALAQVPDVPPDEYDRLEE
jgi:predicted nucleic acid-binding protein